MHRYLIRCGAQSSFFTSVQPDSESSTVSPANSHPAWCRTCFHPGPALRCSEPGLEPQPPQKAVSVLRASLAVQGAETFRSSQRWPHLERFYSCYCQGAVTSKYSPQRHACHRSTSADQSYVYQVAGQLTDQVASGWKGLGWQAQWTLSPPQAGLTLLGHGSSTYLPLPPKSILFSPYTTAPPWSPHGLGYWSSL